MMLIPSLIAFCISVISTILVQKLFFAQNKIDPINHRSSHNVIATRTGGISIYISLLTVTTYYYSLGLQPYDFTLLIPLSIMFIIGVYDDFYNADFKLKFFIQIIVAKILIDLGLYIENYHGFLGFYEVNRLMAQITTVFIFLLVVNAINFIDGIDGLATFILLKVVLMFELFSNSNSLTPLTNFLTSAVLPLIYFNFKKNYKVFLGDAGSLLVGTIIMIYILNILGDDFVFNEDFQINKTLFSILLLTYPLIDLLRVFSIRIFKGKSPFVADKNHIHHLLNKKMNNHFVISFLIVGSEVVILFLVTKFF